MNLHERHTHCHTNTKAVLIRLAKLIDHLETVKRMVEIGRDYSDVLTQLSAVDSAIKDVSRIIIKDHLEHCIVDAVKKGDRSAWGELTRL